MVEKFELDKTEWINLKKEAMACFALTGILANTTNIDMTPQMAAKKSIEYAEALYQQTLLKPTPVEPPTEPV